jgi:Ca-activated chloride channel family protein
MRLVPARLDDAMVNQRGSVWPLTLVTVAALVALGWQWTRVPAFADLWLTRDQQGMRAVADRDWRLAVERFEDPAWQGRAAYYGGMYEDAAAAFARIPTAEGYYNRGVALMKGRDYRNAIGAFELATQSAPDWTEAEENLELARYTLEYIERAREQSDIGEQEDMGADDYRFDNEEDRGREVEITRDSGIGLESADKWMRAVDTDTADFLRTRFAMELARREPL